MEDVGVLEIGISIEPISILEQLLMEESVQSQSLVPANTSTTLPNPLAISQRIGEHLFNFVASFTRLAGELDPNMQVVPFKTVQEWFNNLVKRATNDPDGFMRLLSSKSSQ